MMKSARHLGGFDHLFRSVRLPQGDVVGHRTVKENTVLCDHAHQTAQTFQLEFTHIGFIDLDGSACDIVESSQQMGQGGLSAAGLSDQSDRMARGYRRPLVSRLVCHPRS